MKVSSEGIGPLFIGIKSLGTPNDKDPNRTKFRNDTPLAEVSRSAPVINALFRGVPRVATFQKEEGTFEKTTFLSRIFCTGMISGIKGGIVGTLQICHMAFPYPATWVHPHLTHVIIVFCPGEHILIWTTVRFPPDVLHPEDAVSGIFSLEEAFNRRFSFPRYTLSERCFEPTGEPSLSRIGAVA